MNVPSPVVLSSLKVIATRSSPGRFKLGETARLFGLPPRREPLRPLDARALAGLRIPGDELRNEEAGAEIEVGRAPGHALLLVVREVMRFTRSARASKRARSSRTAWPRLSSSACCAASPCRRQRMARHLSEHANLCRPSRALPQASQRREPTTDPSSTVRTAPDRTAATSRASSMGYSGALNGPVGGDVRPTPPVEVHRAPSERSQVGSSGRSTGVPRGPRGSA